MHIYIHIVYCLTMPFYNKHKLQSKMLYVTQKISIKYRKGTTHGVININKLYVDFILN